MTLPVLLLALLVAWVLAALATALVIGRLIPPTRGFADARRERRRPSAGS